MWRQARRYAALAYYDTTEAVLRLLGRRGPYGLIHVVLSGDLPEQAVEYRLPGLPQREHTDYFALLSQLRAAREDAALRGVFVRCESLSIGWAKVQELRRAVLELRSSGKTVWFYFTQIGLPEYVLASAANRIVAAPAASLDIAGLSSEITFVAGALKKLGVVAEMVHVGKYKSAAETFTRSTMSEPHREMMESLLGDLYAQAVAALAEGRGRSEEDIRALLDRGPFNAVEAEREGLVDALLYEEEAIEQLKAHCGALPVLEMRDYVRRRERSLRKQLHRRASGSIGVLHINGTIRSGDSVAGLDGASACGNLSVGRDLKELRDDDDVKALVVRVSSPGGSGLASDLIWHEVQRTAEKKPVVVSFGDVAASGGYYIAVAGKCVFAEAGTLTGSIGVIAGKAALKGLLDQLGVTREVVSRGRNASLHSSYLPMTDEGRERLQTEAEFFYGQFVDKVAAGRSMSREAVEVVGQGRVWTGKQAREVGLVDEIGGLVQAIEKAKVLAGMSTDAIVRITRYPQARPLWKMAFHLKPMGLQLSELFPELSPWWQHLTSERVWAVLPFRIRFF